jgi:hypothetical protein
MITQSDITTFFSKYFPWILIISLLIYLFSKNPEPIVVLDTKKFEDSILVLNNQVLKLDSINKNLNISYDSLNNVKQQIKIEYREKIVFINSASANQLDSIIRSNIK